MRFEIGPGGGFVILVGLLGLSAAVFFLGMISGREMAQSALSQNQLATTYPLPSGAPQAAPAPVNQAAAPAAAAKPAPAQVAAPSVPASPAHAAVASAGVPAAAMPKPVAEHAAASRPALASAPPPRPVAPAREAASAAAASSAGAGEARTGGGAHRRGYNIVIDAAMDRGGADKMASRLLALGYTPHIIPTLINGGTWYKVEVGPYPSENDARAAQSQLRAAYSARYLNRASAGGSAGAADTSAGGGADAGSDDTGGADSDAPGPSD